MRGERETILPPPSEDFEVNFKIPYTNEFILLSFEGHLKEFAKPEPRYGTRSSYVPGPPGEEPTVDDCGLLSRARKALAFLGIK